MSNLILVNYEYAVRFIHKSTISIFFLFECLGLEFIAGNKVDKENNRMTDNSRLQITYLILEL